MMNHTERKYVYGPVPSRRLGLSLGVDIVPFKMCTYDCIYCQLGRTTCKTLECRAQAPKDAVLTAIEEKVREHRAMDSITFAGSGEPTLNPDLAELIVEIRKMTPARITVITNGSLLWRPEVQHACALADLVMPSLDAGDSEMFQRVNRPCEGLQFETMVQGLVDFRKAFLKPIWLEVFLINGMTDTHAELEKIKKHLDRIQPDRVQLNTAVRPTAEEYALRVPQERLHLLCPMLGTNTEVIASFAAPNTHKRFETDMAEILTLLSRRPCTVDDLADGLQIHRNEALKCVQQLLQGNLIEEIRRDNATYYLPRKP